MIQYESEVDDDLFDRSLPSDTEKNSSNVLKKNVLIIILTNVKDYLATSAKRVENFQGILKLLSEKDGAKLSNENNKCFKSHG